VAVCGGGIMEKYKRLTERVGNEVHELAWNGEILHRLAEYEDKIENGTLIELLCKNGDKIYQFDNGGKIYESEVKSIYYDNKNLIYDCGYFAFDKRALGESIFLTKSEAEKKLEELKNKK
jgi:hypothetical protein